MIITASDFQANLSHYLELIGKEDILIPRDDKKLSNNTASRISAADSLRGMLKHVDENIDKNTLREERLSKYEDHV